MDSIQTLLQYALSAINFLIIITVLVFVHELGHFLFAKMFGMKVDAFAVMVGGIRKTNLEEGLPKRLVPARIVAALYLGSLLLTAFAATQNLPSLYNVGLAVVAFGFPLWIGTRMGALYRYPVGRVAKIFGIAYAASWMMLGVATKGTGFQNPTSILLISFYASIIAILVLYYQPLTQKPDDGQMGFGSIQDNGETKQVRYRPIVSRMSKGGTEFSLLALPLGGFASMRGMHPQADGSEIHVEDGFYSKSPFARFMVLLAGPLFSILLGSLLFFIVFATYGELKLVDQPILKTVSRDGAAGKAGLRDGDKVVSINDRPITTFYEIVQSVRASEGKPLTIVFQRGDVTGTVQVTPSLEERESPVLGPGMTITSEVKRQFKLGAGPPSEVHSLSLAAAATKALTAPIDYARELGSVLSSPQKAAQSVSGPAAIAKETHNASQAGAGSLLILAAILSTSLGFMNLLPVPPLDGGQMVVALAEMFRRGRRLSIETQYTITTVGTFLVVALMLLVFSQDAGRMLGGK